MYTYTYAYAYMHSRLPNSLTLSFCIYLSMEPGSVLH